MAGGARTGMAVILFCDQVGSTAARTSMGDSAADELRRRADQVIGNAITTSGGRVVKWLGDGVVAAFDAASAAVDAAAGVQRSIARMRKAGGPSALQVRIGISAGDVSWEDDDCFGTPVVEAARLESAAAPGTILCSEVVRMLAGSRTELEFQSVGALDLKGLPQPLPACEVVWIPAEEAAPVPLPEAVLRIDRQPLVGRRAERQVLDDLYQRSLGGELVAALVGGEPGAGKTRLIREAARTFHDKGAVVLYGRCDEGLGLPYKPFVEALRFLLENDPTAVENLGRFPAELARVVPELGHLGASSSWADASDIDRYRLFEAFLSWLEAIAADRPLVLLVDDLHWASQPTLDLLRFVVSARSTARVLILATHRDTSGDVGSDLAELLAATAREPTVAHLQLANLTEADVEQLLLGQPDHARLAGVVHGQTGGNAFFVGEVIQHLRDVASGQDALTVPPTVQAVVADRVAGLAAATRHMLEVAAVAGEEVEVDLLVEALGETAEAVEAAVEEACTARLLRELPDPPQRCRFEHALVRSALCDSTPAHRRSRHHYDLGRAIEVRYGHRIHEHLERLAHHFSQSSNPDAAGRVIRYGTEAAEVATRQLAYAQATNHYRIVLDAMRRPDADADDHDRCRALVALGTAQRRSHQAEARTTLIEAADLAALVGDDELLVTAALANTRTVFWAGESTDPQRAFAIERALAALGEQDSPPRAKLLSSLSVERYLADDETTHRQLADAALAMARRLDDVATLAHVHYFRHLTMCRPDTLAERLELAAEMRELVRRNEGTSRFEFGTWAIPGFAAGIEAGRLDVADEALAALTNLSLEVREANLAFNARLAQAVRAGIAGRLDEAEQLADEMLAMGTTAGQRTAPVFHIGLRFHIYFHQGRLEELVDTLAYAAKAYPAVPSLSLGLALALAETDSTTESSDVLAPFVAGGFEGIPFDRDWLSSLSLAARSAWLSGDAAAAAVIRRLMSPYRGQFVSNMTVWLGLVDGIVALLDDTLGDSAAADAGFRAAVDAHRALPAPAMLATTLGDWGQSLVARGEGDAARPLLDEARLLASRLGLPRVHQRATAALAPLDV